MLADCRLLFILVLFFPLIVGAQGAGKSGKQLEKARSAYYQGDLDKALSLAGSIVGRDPGNIDAHLLLADLYHEMDSVMAEIVHLERAVTENGDMPLIFYRLGEAYYRTAAYEEALEAINSFLEMTPQGSLAAKVKHLKKSCEYAAEAVKNPVSFNPENMGGNVNSAYDDYWPSLTVDGKMLVFTRKLPAGSSRVLSQEDFYASLLDSGGWSTAFPLEELNTPMNEGAQSVSADGRLLFFTLCNHPAGFGSCDIFFSGFVNGKWAQPRNAGSRINSPGWEGQPSLSAFGDRLFFSAERPGGKGKKDIWRVDLKGWTKDGNPLWGEVVNMGDSINTPGDEISPFIHPNGKDLYFCSDYRPGFGGYDIFHSKRLPDDVFSDAENLGYPVNSGGNEQGLIIDRKGERAYFSSNRNSTGNMDIFSFKLEETLRPEPVSFIRGKVISKKTGSSVPAEVILSVLKGDLPLNMKIQADENGLFTLTLPPGSTLRLNVNHRGYLFYTEQFMVHGTSSAELPMEKKIELLPAETGTHINLYNIFFTTGDYTILPESEPELETLVSFLKDNPSLKVEIQGHTDNVGTAAFNLQLSDKRASSVRDYLVSKGILPTHLSVKGYGYEMPVASNDTEEGRSKNRRTTIKIL